MTAISRAEIESAIRRLLASELDVSPDVLARIGSDTPLLGRGVGLDSMEAMALAVAIENELDVHFDDAELTARLFATLGELAEQVGRKIAATRGVSG